MSVSAEHMRRGNITDCPFYEHMMGSQSAARSPAPPPPTSPPPPPVRVPSVGDFDASPPQTPERSSSETLRRNWSASDSLVHAELESPNSPSAAERVYCEKRQQAIRALSDEAQMLVSELFAIVTGDDDDAMETECDDHTIIEHSPGYEKSAAQRSVDCERVAAILASGVEGVHANLTWTYGETLLWMALEYDHRHPAQMLKVLLHAGADPNAPNAIDGQRPLQSPWLGEAAEEEEDEHVPGKRALLIQAGAVLSISGDGSAEMSTGGRAYRKRVFASAVASDEIFSRSRSSLW